MLLPDRINANIDELFKSLKELIAFPSVEEEGAPGAPFGTEVEKALEYVLNLGKQMGFCAENHDGYVGTVDWGEGEMLGILSHVDVVPPGDLSAWNSKPFTLTEKDGFLHGRGVADDKGPLLSCLYAMYALKQTGFVPKKKIRLIIGTNEETGWGGINYYKQHLEPPAYAFSPDGMYTVVNREKGILNAGFVKRICAEGATINAGEAGNLVPANAEAVFPGSAEWANAALNAYNAPEGMRFIISEEQNCVKIVCKGKNAPSHSPSHGISAILGLLNVISGCKDAPAGLQTAAAELLKLLGKRPDGSAMGIKCSDEVSGDLTVNLGMLKLENGVLSAVMDVRTPVTVSLDDIAFKVRTAFESKGFRCENEHLKQPLYVSADSDFIKTLCRVYEEVAGEKAVLSSIGGGTYARAFPNCVCFGAVYPNEELTVHAPNERTLKENIIKNTIMYGYAIRELTK